MGLCGWRRLAAAGALLAAGLGSGPFGHKTRPRYQAGLAPHDYVWGGVAPPGRVFSLDAVSVTRSPYDPGVASVGQAAPRGRVVRERVKFFQLPVHTVTLDHCSLSRVALTMHESGHCTLSMRADQNPWMTGIRNEVSTPTHLRGAVSALRPPIPELVRETESLKRNQFIVRVRCYAGYPIREALPELAPGKPVLFEVPVPAFWVQRGVPYDFFDKMILPEARQYFDLIDRVEVEFTYR